MEPPYPCPTIRLDSGEKRASTKPINEAPIDPPKIPPAEPTRDIGAQTSSSSIQRRIVPSMLELSKHGLLLQAVLFLQVSDVTDSSCPKSNASNDTAVEEEPP